MCTLAQKALHVLGNYWFNFCFLMHSLTPIDVPLTAFIATEEQVLRVQYAPDPSGHESWVPSQSLDISGATELDVDVMENMIYWISMTDKVSILL